MSTVENFDDTVKQYLSFLDNEYVSASLSLFLLLYASLAAPKLPKFIAQLFDYKLFKLFIFFLIVFVARKNPTIAIIAAIAVIVSLETLNRYKINDHMMNIVQLEHENENIRKISGMCKCSCEVDENMNYDNLPVSEEPEVYAEEPEVLYYDEIDQTEQINHLHEQELNNSEVQGQVSPAGTDGAHGGMSGVNAVVASIPLVGNNYSPVNESENDMNLHLKTVNANKKKLKKLLKEHAMINNSPVHKIKQENDDYKPHNNHDSACAVESNKDYFTRTSLQDLYDECEENGNCSTFKNEPVAYQSSENMYSGSNKYISAHSSEYASV